MVICPVEEFTFTLSVEANPVTLLIVIPKVFAALPLDAKLYEVVPFETV